MLLLSPLATASALAVALPPSSLTFVQQMLGTTSPVRTVGLPAISLTKTLTSIDITPANPTVSPGATKQFHASGTFSEGSTQDLTKFVTWSTSKTAVGIADGRQRATVWWRFVWSGIDRARKVLV